MLKTRIWLRKTPLAPPTRHVKPLRIRYTPHPKVFRNTSVIADQLRALAINTDGNEAAVGAFDPELMDRGMRFRFTSDLKLNEFKGRVQNYIAATITKRMTFSV